MPRPKGYPSDLTEHQWELIKDLIPPARPGGRPRTTEVKLIVNAVFYLTRTGCAWRYLPKEYPPWKTVYDYFSAWKRAGLWQQIHITIAKQVRIAAGRSEEPSTLIIDAQSVRAQYGEERGREMLPYESAKEPTGRLFLF